MSTKQQGNCGTGGRQPDNQTLIREFMHYEFLTNKKEYSDAYQLAMKAADMYNLWQTGGGGEEEVPEWLVTAAEDLML